MNGLKWFYPGLSVKRWIALIMAGALIFCLGAVFIIGRNIPRDFYFFVTTYVRQGVFGISLAIIGILCVSHGARQLNRRIISLFAPDADDSRLVDLLYRDMLLNKGVKVVVIGGGTGLHSLLRGLKQYTSNITAVVTVSDDGGSSGRLRDEMNIIPPGDIRQCIAALADSETAIHDLFSCRFESGGSLHGHSVGNLLLAAMAELKGGDFYQAIKELSKVLAVRGQVLPSTLERVSLCAENTNGLIIRGESNITSAGRIKRVFLSPADCRALPETIEAIAAAEVIVIGPGSLFTSIIPNLLVKDISQALRKATAPKIYVCNIMSQPGETEGFTASDHAAQIVKILGKHSIDYIVLNNKYPSRLLDRYKSEGQTPVVVDRERLEKLGIRHLVASDLIREDELVRHDPKKLADTIMAIARKEVARAKPLQQDMEKIREKLMQLGI